jgi:uncharacterized protein YdaU (DUF1376 family)
VNYYPRFPAHYQTKTLHLTMEQDGAYTRLLDWYYANERPIPHAQRYAVARAMTASERRSVDQVLAEFFVRSADDWHQERADAEILKAQPKLAAARANGKKSGGRPRKNPQGGYSGTHEEPNGFSLGSKDGTHGEPGAKAPQSPIPITPSEGENTSDTTLSSAPAACDDDGDQLHAAEVERVLEPYGGIPAGFPRQMLARFIRHRAASRKPVTAQAWLEVRKRLNYLAAEGHDLTESLRQTIRAGLAIPVVPLPESETNHATGHGCSAAERALAAATAGEHADRSGGGAATAQHPAAHPMGPAD